MRSVTTSGAFLALTLPPQSVLWSALLAGQPVRPGLSAEGAYLLPLQKGRTGENAPTFAVELVYLQRATAWDVKGNARVELPAVDLPVSRTGLLVHYSPRFEVEPKSGAFRPETDPGPWSAALRAEMTGIARGVAGTAAASARARREAWGRLGKPWRARGTLPEGYGEDHRRRRAGASPTT